MKKTFTHHFSLWTVLCLFLLLLAMPFTAQASTPTICLLDGNGLHDASMPFCANVSSLCGDQSSNAATDAYGLRLNEGTARTPIDVHGLCRYTDNSSTDDFFVPFKSAVEWLAFLDAPVPGVTKTHCARPFNGQNISKGLYFGTTSALFPMGDTGDAVTADVSLPYWRTAQTWPPSAASCSNATHTFNNQCYEEYSQYKCWKWVTKTCTGSSCIATNPKTGACKAYKSYTYDCSYCGDPGSTCEKKWYGWSETFAFLATALDSDTQNPSWQGTSTRTTTATRPTQCMTRCTFNGHDCTGCSGGTTSCVPSGVTTCSAGRKYNSCGVDIGACSTCCCTYWGY